MIPVLALQGCDSVNQAVAQAKTTVGAAMSPSASSSGTVSSPSTPRLAGSELNGIFKRYPLGSPQARDGFPRVAVTIVSATPSIFQLGAQTADQCIRFNVRLWSDAKTSRSFDGLQMCNADISLNVPFVYLLSWPQQFTVRDSTGAVRTDGPRRPKTNFPTDSRTLDAWFERPRRGIYFIGSILDQLGYDWAQPGEERLWFVSAPNA